MYFDYKDREAQTAENVFRNLLRQLLTSLDIIPAEIEQAYDRAQKRFAKPDLNIFTSLFVSTSSNFSQVFVLFDGLDECAKENIDDVVEGINRLLDSPRIRILCTSRPHAVNLKTQLKPTTEIWIEASHEDIKNFLAKRLEKWPYAGHLKMKIISTLSQMSKGMSVSSSDRLQLIVGFYSPSFKLILFFERIAREM